MSSTFDGQTSGDEVCATFSQQIKDRVFLITGTSANGLGAQYATMLAKHSPAQLILVSRSKAKVEPVIEEIRALDAGLNVKFVQCELSDQDSIRHAADIIIKDKSVPKIDIVINNAGIMGLDEYTSDKHGIELQLSSNHLGHFLLTNLLMPKILAAGRGARIINLTSHGHRIGPFRFDDANFQDGKDYDPWSSYGQSKTANILFTVELARRLSGAGVHAFSVHPGLITTTGLGDHLDWNPDNWEPGLLAAVERNNPGLTWSLDGHLKTVAQGAASTLVAALDPQLETSSPAFIQDCRVGSPMPYATDPENAKNLWLFSEKAVGQRFG